MVPRVVLSKLMLFAVSICRRISVSRKNRRVSATMRARVKMSFRSVLDVVATLSPPRPFMGGY